MKKILATLFTTLLSFNLFAETIWIDVRTAQELETGYLSQARHIPHNELVDKISQLTQNKDADIRLYCRSGNRAGIAKAALEEIGFTNITNEGGYNDVKHLDSRSN